MNADLATTENTKQWTIGISTEFGPGEISAGYGTNGAIADDVDELYAYEVKYSYPINDGMTLDSYAFVAETAAGLEDTQGLGFLTTFKF